MAAGALSRVLSSVLFGVSPADPIGLGGAALLVLGVALAAGVLAALPATRADPTRRCATSSYRYRRKLDFRSASDGLEVAVRDRPVLVRLPRALEERDGGVVTLLAVVRDAEP